MEIEEEKSNKMTGWGSWTGIGIEKKQISNEEKIKRKKMEIVCIFLNAPLNIFRKKQKEKERMEI